MEVAKIGIEADTSGVEKATGDMNKLKEAAAGVSDATGKVALSVAKSSLATARAARQQAAAQLKALQATGKVTQEQIKQAKQSLKNATAHEAERKAILATARANEQNAKSMMEVVAAGRTQSSRRNQQLAAGGVANDLMPNRFNTANIAAQFQDIGVTAAMGMNPMTIALQQGTQLSAILNTMENPLKGIAVAFRSIINPVSLVSIGIVGLIAGLVQLVNWTSVASSGLNMTANAMDFLAGNADILSASILGLTVVITFLKWRTVATAIWAVATATWGLVVATWALTAPYLAAGAAAAAFVAVLYGVSNFFGGDFIQSIKTGINTGIGLIVGFLRAAGAIFTSDALSKIFVGAFSSALNLVGTLIETSINGWIAAINAALNKIPAKVRDKLGISLLDNIDIPSVYNPLVEGGSEAAGMIAKSFKEALGTDWVSVGSEKIKSVAQSAAAKLRSMAVSVASGEEDKKKKDPYAEVVAGAQRRIASLEAERKALGLTSMEADILKNKQDLINQAMQKNIDLTPAQIQELGNLAESMARINQEIEQTKKMQELAKSSAQSFFDTLKQGLKEGKGLWKSFGDAVLNVLNKIFDKILESGVNDLTGAFNMAGGGGSLFSDFGKFLFSANGNAFTSQGVQKFANGDSFTNGIYSSPTMFTFANGSKFGVMGEAGPEAVMPLQRAPDGSLGVKLVGGQGGSGGNVIVNVNNNSNAKASVSQTQTSQGMEIDVMIDETVGGKLGTQGTSSNRALQAYNNRQLISRG